MKTLLIALSFIIASAAKADGGCTALINYVGSYVESSRTCNDSFQFLGSTLKVNPYFEARYSGYLIESNGKAFGPTTSNDVNDVDRCVVQGGDVTVEITANDKSGMSLPRSGRFLFRFSGATVAYTADGCTATYLRAP